MLVIKGQQILLRATVRKAAGPEELPQAAEQKGVPPAPSQTRQELQSGQGAARGSVEERRPLSSLSLAYFSSLNMF